MATPTATPVAASASTIIPIIAQPKLLRGCQPVTPYQAGFEDCRYQHEYNNPFPIASAPWGAYEQGNQDARRSNHQ